jgi:hypothetical protein
MLILYKIFRKLSMLFDKAAERMSYYLQLRDLKKHGSKPFPKEWFEEE